MTVTDRVDRRARHQAGALGRRQHPRRRADGDASPRCRLLQHLVDGHAAGDATITEALRTRTFYVVPRVNPDGAEWVLADRPRYRRRSVRPWPWPTPTAGPASTRRTSTATVAS